MPEKLTPRGRRLRDWFNTTEEVWQKVYNFEGGVCPICGKPLTRPETDHEHASGLWRGILCGGRYAGCNRRLGLIDDPVWLRKALAYLENPPATRALGHPHFAVPGRHNTKKGRKLIRKMKKGELYT